MKLTDKRIIIAGTGSGCGKTTVTLGLLQCLKSSGISTASFKCGPDYIDPMFHEKVLGVKSENLDLFFSDEEMIKYLAAIHSQGLEISVVEGVMGYYDGIGLTERASTYHAAAALDAPSVLVIDAKGMSSSVLAVLEGFLHHKPDSRIRGVIFNRLPAKLYEGLSERVRQLGVEPLGYLPSDSRVEIGSRHLGLVTAGEIAGLQTKVEILAELMKKTVDIDGIVRLASEAEPVTVGIPEKIAFTEAKMKKYFSESQDLENLTVNDDKIGNGNGKSRFPRIAFAEDEAFCFTYASNLDLLEKFGAKIVSFSPLHDAGLPPDIDGLILSGGYPELYAPGLSKNKEMLHSVRQAVSDGMPVFAECGGFMYLHRGIESVTAQGLVKMYEMVGVIDGWCYRRERLGRFGYIELTATKNGMIANAGDRLKAHEFHYWESSSPGDFFETRKADGSSQWTCGFSQETIYAGFPHLFFCSVPETAERFVKTCAEYRRKRNSHIL